MEWVKQVLLEDIRKQSLGTQSSTNFRYNELVLLLRHTDDNVSQADVSLGLVVWSSFEARVIDLGIIFITIFSKVMEVIHRESGETIRTAFLNNEYIECSLEAFFIYFLGFLLFLESWGCWKSDYQICESLEQNEGY